MNITVLAEAFCGGRQQRRNRDTEHNPAGSAQYAHRCAASDEKEFRRSHKGKPQPWLLLATWLAAFLSPLLTIGVASAAEPYSAAAMWHLKRLADPAISPDGRLAVVAVTTYDMQKNQGDSDLWLIPTKSGKPRQLTSAPSSDSSPAWSPDGELIAFVSKRGEDQEPQIYVIPVNGGEARRVTNVPTGATAPKWFPDSRRIAFLSQVWTDLQTWPQMEQRKKERDETKMTARVWDKAPFSYWDRFLDDRRTHVYSVGIEGGEPKAITVASGHALEAAEPDQGSYDISPDGTEIAFASDLDTQGNDPNFDIFVMPVDGGEARDITADSPANDLNPLYSPDGRLLAYRKQAIKGFYADRARLMLYDRRNSTTRNLTENWDRSADALVWAPDSHALFGAIDDAGVRRVYRFETSGDTPKAITTEHSFSSLAVAGSGPVIIGLRESFAEPPTLVSIIARNGTATKLSEFNDAALAALTPGKFESVTYPGANGEAVQMWVVYPPNFTPDRKWPLHLLLHGGPHNGVTDAYQWRWNAQIFANWGYVTAWHNFHGSSGFGQAWADSITREWAELPYQDTLKAAEWFASKPWIDPQRMAAGGGSYGGYLAAVLLGRPHPFKTLIAHAGVYDLYSQVATDDGANRQRYGEYWQDFERTNRNSPHMNAANFNTPTLIIHGQLDRRVPVNNSFELFNTLQNRGVPSKLVYFPDENHWILKPQNSLFWYETNRQWLTQYVKPGPGETAPANASGHQPQ
ncbi:MAG TPA: S9 family peptidase [Steroidobacteraceae bacterium]|jgi:dipeptidyl aminopeptidase/acylaminoacyl peptidase